MATTQGSGTAPQWDLTTDVLVVGYGGAGVAAAIEAREAGARVLAVDRFAGGGATAISGGIVYAGGGTAVQRLAGVSDDAEQMYNYLALEVGDAVSEQVLRRFCAESPAMIEWLAGHGVPFHASLCPYKTSYPNNDYFLYYSGSEAAGGFRDAAVPAPRGHRAHGKGMSGKTLFESLAAAADRAGVELLDYTRVTELVTDETGRVIGVEAETMGQAPRWAQKLYARLARISDKPGVYQQDLRRIMQRRLRALEAKYLSAIRIGAERGVVLTTGGFIANREMVRRYAPDYRHGLPLGTAACDGSGIEMAQSLGAATDKMGEVSVWRFITPPTTLLTSVSVNRAGERIGDESRYGAAMGRELVAEHGGHGWLVLDAEQMAQARKEARTQTVWFQWLQGETLLRTRAKSGQTLEEAAAKAGVDPAGVRATVDAHNAALAAGAPDPAGKPAEFVRPVRTAPFTLLDVSTAPAMTFPTPMLTLGGLVVDEDTGAVLTEDGGTVPGLYAAGRAAVGICSNSYVSGLSVADAFFSGRRAGVHVAAAQTADR